MPATVLDLSTSLAGAYAARLLSAAGLAVTASVGVASTNDSACLPELARSADQRLYEAKRSGRDRVVGSARRSIGPAVGRISAAGEAADAGG